MKLQPTLAIGLTGAALAALAFTLTASLAQEGSGELDHQSFLAPQVSQNASAFTYQGQLRRNNQPVTAFCNASFSLWDAAGGGAQIGGTVTSATLPVRGGFFTIPLDFGWDAFNGEARWLETAIGCGEAQATLAPRTPLRPAPYAFALPGLRTVPADDDAGRPTINVIGGVMSGTISNTISSDSYNGVIAGGSKNRIANGSEWSMIVGGRSNAIDNGSYGSAIAGTSNRIDNGSYRSTIAGGTNNSINDYSSESAIGGGLNNTIDRNSYYSAIGGGTENLISGTSRLSVIGGGLSNTISSVSYWSTIGGGTSNEIAWAGYATIPGGHDNRVEGDYGFAAGRRAQALHDGSFVWGDSTDAVVASTHSDQFLIRAGNGVSLSVNAGSSKNVAVGERFRDNAIIAWARVSAAGDLDADYGVSSVSVGTAGIYTVTISASTINQFSFIPVATAELDAPPTGLADMRVVMVNQISNEHFAIYIMNGSGTRVSNDFTFVVTGR